MKLHRQGKTNAIEVDKGDRVVLFSYSTAVAVLVKDDGWYRTSQHYSVTTSRHVNQWLGGVAAKVVSQAEIDRLAGEAETDRRPG